MKTSCYLARFFGLYMVSMAFVLVVAGNAMRTQMVQFIDDPGFILFGGIFSLVAGWAIVAGHNVWESSWRTAITVIGYLSVFKGVMLLIWPDQFLAPSRAMMETNFTLPYALIVGPLGAWLAWLGYRRMPDSKDRGSPPVPA